MKEIILTRGKVAIVDDEDYDELSKHKWFCNSRGYAARSCYEKTLKKQITVYMHIEIAHKLDGLEIDHVNGNPLDNRKENLRHVTHAQNMCNRPSDRNASSEYKGVSWHSQNKRWTAHINFDGHRVFLGIFKKEEDAALAYNRAAKELHGEYARLNAIGWAT